MEYSVIAYQTVFDIALQVYGTIEGVPALCKENNLAVTDELTPGQHLKIPAFSNSSNDIVSYYANRRIQPASTLKDFFESSRILVIDNRALIIDNKVITF